MCLGPISFEFLNVGNTFKRPSGQRSRIENVLHPVAHHRQFLSQESNFSLNVVYDDKLQYKTSKKIKKSHL